MTALRSDHGTAQGYVVAELEVVRFRRRMNLRFGAISATYYAFHPLSELLVQQGEYKRIDGRIYQDHRVSDNGW